MKTLDYLHLDASAVSNVVASLKQLLADYQVFYTNLGRRAGEQVQRVFESSPCKRGIRRILR